MRLYFNGSVAISRLNELPARSAGFHNLLQNNHLDAFPRIARLWYIPCTVHSIDGESNMKIAVSTWNGRISPVFDVSRQMVVVEIDQGIIQRKSEESLHEDIARKVEKISEDGIQFLICGAISQSLADALVLRGIRIIPFITGTVDEVIEAWITNRLNRSCFAMPGCCGRGRRRLRTKCRGNTGHR